MDNKQKFEVAWKLALLIVLIVGICLMIVEFKHFNKEAMSCAQSPDKYIQKKAEENGFFCAVECFKDNQLFKPVNFSLPQLK